MKKIIAFVLCLSMLFTLMVSTVLAESVNPVTNSGSGKGTSYFCTAKIAAKKGYYAWATCTVTGTYRADKFSSTYTKSDTADATGANDKALSVTARCWARAENHLKVSHSISNVKGARYKNN